ncbi:MAG: anti-sigma-K factor RskA [Cocleimonas sp.]|jgi:anti-sigma-K factor RskA
MHELKSTPKRYQNPEVFELLAMEYAVGSLQGRARQRFEVLMDTHFYLRATVDAYEAKFANLVELLPEKQPSNQIWNNIEAHIKESSASAAKGTSLEEEKTPWWQMNFFKQGFGLAAMALIISAVLVYNPMTDHNPNAVASYSAVMESDNNGETIAVTKIQKSDMKLTIDIMKPMAIADGMELTLWCHPRAGGKPMKMGTISKSGKTELNISEQEWKDLQNVGQLAVSVEKKGNSNITSPSEKIILKGQLSSAL